MKGYSAFPNAPAFLETYHQLVLYYYQDTCLGESSEMQSVYSAAPADWASYFCKHISALEKTKLLLLMILRSVIILPKVVFFYINDRCQFFISLVEA